MKQEFSIHSVRAFKAAPRLHECVYFFFKIHEVVEKWWINKMALLAQKSHRKPENYKNKPLQK